MEKKIMAIFTRTPLHVGAGNSVGAIDSPIMRERHTRIPIIPGSSLKGVLKDLFNDRKEEQNILFGKGDSAGKLHIGEARVLAFPVRSAKGSFAWITSPIALARYERDSGIKMDIDKLDGLEDSQCFGAQDVILGKDVVLEEYKFESQGLSEDIASKLEKTFDDKIWKTVATRLVIVNDEIFSYFCENACEVVTRICIDDETGVTKSGALFNQEQVPSETMFYAVIGEQKDGYIETLKKSLSPVLQIGGDETIGLGFCSVVLYEVTK
ncbi:MAG TPA: type III-B CRISPR module RAMP protein Cmr4 [Lentisphaeria bacterium]|nr:MAG: type III-B CRISPR module RAMP protein Cmr4 [Lentisphaerae bacterium GWF2_38_69]HBM15081.1 type III-B CRISPR module RAMP protein Cmr4 [Lentisphaeria bacterium]